MRYVKSMVVGIVTAIVSSFCWVLLRLFMADLNIGRQMLDAHGRGAGSSGVGFVIDISYLSILAPALIGSVVGFGWIFRRSSRQRHATS